MTSQEEKKPFKNTFKYIFFNCSNILQYYCFYCIFTQINAVLASIRDFFWKLFKNLIWPNFWVPVCKYHYMKVENIIFYNADIEVEESINKHRPYGLHAYSEPTFMKDDVIFDCEWVWTCFYLNGSQQVYMTEILRLTVSCARNIRLTNDIMLQSHFELVQTYSF